MEPVSVIASISGALTATKKISSAAATLIYGWKEAPNSIRAIVAEMSALDACLSQIKPYLEARGTNRPSRMSVITVEQIVIVTTSCVLAVSELQRTLDALEPDKPLSKITKLRWYYHEQKLNSLRSRVYASMSSLNLILTIITCSSSEESRQSMKRLERTLDHILRTDLGLSHRIRDAHTYAPQTRYATPNNESLFSVSDNASVSTMKNHAMPQVDVSSNIQDKRAFGLDPHVEYGLFSSFVYLRAHGRHSASSLPSTSGTGPKQRWSFFSHLGLTEISNLSVISLPVSCQELWNPQQFKRRTLESPSSRGPGINSARARSLASTQDSTQTPLKLAWRTSPHRALSTLGVKVLGGKYSTMLNEAEARRISAAIDRDIGSVKAKNPASKVLLLGAGEGGKSTLLKQIRLAYTAQFSLGERLEWSYVVASNLLNAFDVILQEFYKDGLSFRNAETQDYAETISKSYKAYIAKDSSVRSRTISTECAFAMKAIWTENDIQQISRRGNDYALYDTFASFIRDVDRFASPSYLPTENDILRARLRSTGVTDCHFRINRRHCRVFDVGGSRVERKKWVHSFEMINYLVFVAPLSGYCQCLIEDKSTNQLQEAITFFESVLKMSQFQLSSLILVLSKIDLLPDKLCTNPIKQYWPDYDGPPEHILSVTQFFRNKFLNFPEAAGRNIQVYVADLTDVGSTRQLLERIVPKPTEEQTTKNQFSFYRSGVTKHNRMNRAHRKVNSLPHASSDAGGLQRATSERQRHERRPEKDVRRGPLKDGAEVEDVSSKEEGIKRRSGEEAGEPIVMGPHERRLTLHTKGASIG